MVLEKLNKLLEGALDDSPIQVLNELQEKTIARIKQGGDAVVIAGPKTGRSTAIAISALVKAPESYEGSPRVLVLCSTIDKAHKLHEQLSRWVRRTEISIELAHDKGNMVLERNNIFDGADILIGTTKRILDLYIQNGFHVGKLTLFVLDDASELVNDAVMAQRIVRLIESLPKCQRFVYTAEVTPRIEKLIEDICVHPVTMTFEDAPVFS